MYSEWNVTNDKTRVQRQYYAKLVRILTRMMAQVIKRFLSIFALKCGPFRLLFLNITRWFYSALNSKPYPLCVIFNHEKLHTSRINQRDPPLDSVDTTCADKEKTKDVFCIKTNWLALVFLLNGAHIPLNWKCVREDHPSIYPTLKVH